MKLLIQPRDGVGPLVKAVEKAKKSVQILIFRFDRPEVRNALVEAVQRGVSVQALIAFTNHGGEKKLRELEADFLANGITLGRTAGDLTRYHGKLLLLDHKELYVLCFNLTQTDIEHSRSFGLLTRNPKLLREAANLFDTDSKRQSYRPGYGKFVVSPENARKVLGRFIEGARRELVIYDPEISDRDMIRLLRQRKKAGVKLRIIGAVRGDRLSARELKGMRLHARVIIRDRYEAFLGSQSLRQQELDARREIGVIFRNHAAIKALLKTFRDDWTASAPIEQDRERRMPVTKAARRMAKVFRSKVPVKPAVERVVKELRKVNGDLDAKKVEKSVEKAVQMSLKHVVRKAAKEAVEEVFEETAG